MLSAHHHPADPDAPDEPGSVECDGCGCHYPAEEIHSLRGKRLCAEHFVTEATALRAAVLDPAFTLTADQLREVERLGAEIDEIDAEIRFRIRQRWAEIERAQRETFNAVANGR